MNEYRTEITVETGQQVIDYVSACFMIEQYTGPAEPYSWGGKRGTETETFATLKWVRIGDLVLESEMVRRMAGDKEVARIEKFVAQKYEDLER